MEPKRFVIDLDHTVCIPNLDAKDSHGRYAKALPIPEMIEYIQSIYACGNYVILFTARRMVTHDGNLARVIMDIGDITEKWLADHNVPYHELIFGKPYGDFYIDDKALRPDELFPVAQD